MKSGYHTHECERCQESYVCALVTHCSRPDVSGLCDRCALDEVTVWNEAVR